MSSDPGAVAGDEEEDLYGDDDFEAADGRSPSGALDSSADHGPPAIQDTGQPSFLFWSHTAE